MLRGTHEYTCEDCGHQFLMGDIELLATVASMPVRCPRCGSSCTSMSSMLALAKWLEKIIKRGR